MNEVAKRKASPSLRDNSLVPAVAKAIEIIRYLNGQTKMEATLHTLAIDLSITKSHCHNIMKTLLAAGWVNYDPQRRVYSLASRMLADISRMLARQEWPNGMHDELVRLSARIGTPCVLTRIDPDGSYVAIDKAEEGAEFQVSVPVGHRFAPDSTAQFRIRLAWSDKETLERELAAWRPIRHTPSSIVDRDEMERQIRLTRERGYAVSRAEYTPGVMTFAAPIFDVFGSVRLILISVGVADDMTPREDDIVRDILASVAKINSFYNDIGNGQPVG